MDGIRIKARLPRGGVPYGVVCCRFLCRGCARSMRGRGASGSPWLSLVWGLLSAFGHYKRIR